MKALIIAEKSTVGNSIADAFDFKTVKNGYIEGIYKGKDYIVTWARGHLVALYDCKDYDPSMAKWQFGNFPFFPDKFRYKIIDQTTKKRLSVIDSLIKRDDINAVIVATDADREGQLISKTILDYLKVKKPSYRMLLNSWTPKDVKNGLNNLVSTSSNEMELLSAAAESRQWADWLLGINLTSVATLKYSNARGKNSTLNVGRVIMPTLKIIYDRDMAINNFTPKNYFKLLVDFKNNKGDHFEALYIDTKNKTDKFNNKIFLEKIQSDLKNKFGKVIDKSVTIKKETSPILFSLTTLQGYVTSRNPGWTASKVLDIAQKLYENKFITYPRTESMYIEESLIEDSKKVLELLKQDNPFSDQIKFEKSNRIFNSSKVNSHSALTPTYILPEKLSHDEAIVYDAIKNRFIIQFMLPAEYEETKIAIKVPDIGFFYLRGKIEKNKGWKAVEKIKSKDVLFPKIELSDSVQVYNTLIKTDVTKPPEHHSFNTLKNVMLSCGKYINKNSSEDIINSILSGFTIGASSTRGEIVERLKNIGYIYQKGKYLYCSDLGKSMVEKFPVKDLFDLEYTGHMEKLLSDIENGILSKDTYLKLIKDFTRKSVDLIKSDKDIVLKNKSSISYGEEIGKCPVCGKKIIESKKGFICEGYKKTCDFAIWKDDKYMAAMGKKVTKKIARDILNKGKARIMNLKSKKGTKFDAYFTYLKKPGSKYYSWIMQLKK